MGGYVSGPAVGTAKLCGVPIILHEQNAIAGLTNKLLGKIAACVLHRHFNYFPHAEVVSSRDLLVCPDIRFFGS